MALSTVAIELPEPPLFAAAADGSSSKMLLPVLGLIILRALLPVFLKVFC